MTITFSTPQREPELKPRITVIGVGGAGGNAVNNMISASLEGVEFVVANTDAQAIAQSLAERRIQLGKTITQGLGAGARPDVGRAAAEETLPEIIEHLQGSNMVFVAAGMGGGTGTGAAPVIAAAAREQGILTVGVVTRPFQFEGNHRMRTADAGIQELEKYVDTLIIIPNQNLFRVANERTTFADAFKMADDVLCTGVRGVTDLMVMPGLINLDFADIRTVMSEMGKAMMGTGEASGEDRAKKAAEAAISNPLLEDASMKGARGVLINITGGLDMTLMEVDEAANRIRDEVDPDANIIFGSTFDHNMEGRMRVSVVATGISISGMAQPKPTLLPLARDAVAAQPAPAQRPAAAAAAPQPAAVPLAAAAPVAAEPAREPLFAEPVQAPIAQPQPAAPEPQFMQPAAVAPAAMRPASDIPAADWRVTVHAAPAAAQAPAAPRMQAATQPMVAQASMQAAPAAMGRAGGRAAAQGAAGRAAPAPRPAPAAEPPARAPSLFQRITGVARREAAAAATALKPQTQYQPQAIEPEPVQEQAPPPPAPRPEPKMRPVQPKLGGLDPSDRLQSARAEEDLLDIPAFLRRQAN